VARGGSGGAVLAGFAVIGWLGFRQMPSTSEDLVSLERVTFGAGLTTTPALSRDGRLMAYASDRTGRGDLDIWVQQADGGAPIRLTDDETDDYAPDFSPDGQHIVFRSERDGGGIYLVPALGGPERLLVRAGRRPRYSPDGLRLAYWVGQFRGPAIRATSGAFVVPLTGGPPEQLLPAFAVVRDPIWAPDGRSLLVLGRPDRTSLPEESVDWWWVPLDGEPVRTGASVEGRFGEATFAGAEASPGAWTADGVLFSWRGNIWSIEVSPANGQASGVPRRLTTGTAAATGPVASADGRIVFAVAQNRRVIERAALDEAVRAPEQLYSDNRDFALRASQTADGTRIVFDQGFEAYREIWMRNVLSGDQQLIVRVDGPGVPSPTVSPDGSRIAYLSGDVGAMTSGTGHVIEASGGVPRTICEGCGLYGFLSDSRRLLATLDTNRMIGVIDTVDQTRHELMRVSEGTVNRPHASPDDKWLAFRWETSRGPKSFVTELRPDRPTSPSDWHLIEEPTITGRPAGWSPDSRTLYLFLDTDGFRCLWGQRIDPVTGRPQGSVFAVRHFHVQTDNGPSTSLGNPVNHQGLLYERISRTGDIWRLVRTARQ
jgi:Tol biopolymer transport system component